MISYAIIHRQGGDRFLREAVTAGFDGLIVPDLPVEESDSLCRLATSLDLRLIQLVTPTTPRETGRPDRPVDHRLHLLRLRRGDHRRAAELAALNWPRTSPGCGPRPTCRSVSGSGSARPSRSASWRPVADGLIVGSALVRRLAGGQSSRPMTDLVREIGDFVADLATGLKPA